MSGIGGALLAVVLLVVVLLVLIVSLNIVDWGQRTNRRGWMFVRIRMNLWMVPIFAGLIVLWLVAHAVVGLFRILL